MWCCGQQALQWRNSRFVHTFFMSTRTSLLIFVTSVARCCLALWNRVLNVKVCWRLLREHTVMQCFLCVKFFWYITRTHTHATVLRLYGFCLGQPGLSQVSQYQKKRSPIHTYHGYQSSLICFIHLLWSMASSLFNPRTGSLFPQSLSKFSLVYLLPGTLHFILHTFLHPIIVFFLQHVPIPSQPASL